jgi:archaellum component FlaC/ArsR family metal-binding transcriptional regulator
VGFSTPGGLLDTAERFIPGIRRNTRKIEGVHSIYPYLQEVAELLKDPDVEFPLLIDCLNCEKGCNGGPGTGNCFLPTDKLETPIRRRSAELEKRLSPGQRKEQYEKYHKLLEKHWKPGLYNRSYRNLSENFDKKTPNEAELTEIYRTMKKYAKSDILDCGACGYKRCRRMAMAIHNGINKPENCSRYTLAVLKEKKDTEELNRQLQEHINLASGLIEGIGKLVQNLNATIGSQAAAVDKSSDATEKMIGSIKDTSELSLKQQKSVNELIEIAGYGQESMRKTIQSIKDISQSVEGISSAIQIIASIAANTNLLSMNAAIEAAHAGESGKGFAVVAGEIRRLSETTRENSVSISRTLKSIITGIAGTSKQSGETDNRIAQMSAEINGFAETMSSFINTFRELSEQNVDITASLVSLKEQSSAVKTGYAQMFEMIENLASAMSDLSALSSGK